MPLDVKSMEPTQDRTYEGIPARPGRPGNPPAVNGHTTDAYMGNDTYMGIDPRTRDPTEKAQYMGLKDARSN